MESMTMTAGPAEAQVRRARRVCGRSGGAAFGVVVSAGLALVACSGAQSVPAPSFAEVVPTTAAVATSTTVAASTTAVTVADTVVVVESTVPEVTVDAGATEASMLVTQPSVALVTLPADEIIPGSSGQAVTFSAALGVKVALAPGVNTPGDTRLLLPEGLYVHIAWQPDPNDSSIFNPSPEDIEILEAYANASTAYYRASLTTTTIDSPDFALYFVDAGAGYEAAFAEARAGGWVGSLGNGVVLRPYVLGDRRTDTNAVILDCYLQNEGYILRDGGVSTLAPLQTKGTVATMTKQSGHWQVDYIGSEAGACT